MRSLGTSSVSVARSSRRAAGDLGGHEEEGIGWEFREWWARVATARAADEVRVHDFLDPTLGKAIPYGV